MARKCFTVTSKSNFYFLASAFYGVSKLGIFTSSSGDTSNNGNSLAGFGFRGMVGIMLTGFFGYSVWSFKDNVEYLINDWMKQLESKRKNN